MLLGCSWHLQRFFFFLGAAERSVVNRSWLQFRKLPGNSESVRAPANFAAFGLFRESSDIFVHWHALPVQLRHFVCPRVGVTVRWSSPSQWRHEWRERGIYRCVRKACCYIRCRLRCVCPLKCNTLNSRRKLWGHRVGVGWRLFGSDLVLCEPLDASITCGTTDILRKK